MSFNSVSPKRDLIAFCLAMTFSFTAYYFIYSDEQERESAPLIYRHSLDGFSYLNWSEYEQSFFAGKSFSFEEKALLKLTLFKALREKHLEKEKKERVDLYAQFYQSFLADSNEVFIVKVLAYKNLKLLIPEGINRLPASVDPGVEAASKKTESELVALTLSISVP